MHENERPQATVERIGTGIRGVDQILGGGFVPGSVQLVVGRPGAGKTIFANQFAFHNAKAGHNVVYVTLLAESHARMLMHLAQFAFFDAEMVSRRILYMSGYGVLEQGGLDGLLELLRRTIRENSASLLIIDSLSTAKEFAETTMSFKRFLLRLATSASLTTCTTLLVSQISRIAEPEPERGTVDGILRLDKRFCEPRELRWLMVEKMRATSYPLGMHMVEIDQHGLHTYPRLESMPMETASARVPRHRLAFGIKGLDAMLGGGVMEGSTTVVVGPPGTGKTLLGSSFLAAGFQHDERALFAGLQESPERIVHQARGVGLEFPQALARGMLDLLWFPTLEVSLDAIAWQLLDRVERKEIKRVFIDGIDAFAALLIYRTRLQRFCTALISRLTNLGCTTVMAEGAAREMRVRQSDTIASTDNVLVLSESTKAGRVYRFVTSHKVQASQHDIAPRRLRISNRGLSVDKRRVWLFHEDKP